MCQFRLLFKQRVSSDVYVSVWEYEYVPHTRSLLLVSWCPLISWCCRGFQNGASGSGISFHCHDNDSDTLAPSNSDQPLYGNRNAISPAAATDNPL